MIKTIVRIAAFSAMFQVLAHPVPAQTPLGTAFTYQGRLQNAGSPASGLHDLRFSLYDAGTIGAPVGAVLCLDNVSVSDGLFTVPLDFGAQFAGQDRFLEIEVRADTGLGCGNGAGFVTLSPRQALTATPNALFSLNTSQFNGQPPAFYQNAANLTTGTLDVARFPTPLILSGSSSTNMLRAVNSSTTPGASGIVGISTATSGGTAGVAGDSSSTQGIGVYGYSGSETGVTYGVLGENYSSQGTAIAGLSVADSGLTKGVYGRTNSPDGRGVYGEATAPSGVTNGVYGNTNSPNGRGVYGQASAASGSNVGVYGETASASGYAGYFLGGKNYFQGNVGIGTTSPANSIHVQKGSAGAVTPYSLAPLIVESSTQAYINLLTPASGEQGILFGNPTHGATAGGLIYNNSGNTNGLQFRVNGNTTVMTLSSAGNLGVGTTSPTAKLDVNGSVNANGNLVVGGTVTHGLVLRSYIMHGTELRPDSGVDSAGVIYDDIGLRDTNGSANDAFYASPHLPDGATVLGLQMLGHDTYPPADMTCVLGRTNFTGLAAAMASVVSNLGGNVWQTTSISLPVVDNDSFSYWVRVNMGGGVPEFEHRIYAIKIIYSITSPLP